MGTSSFTLKVGMFTRNSIISFKSISSTSPDERDLERARQKLYINFRQLISKLISERSGFINGTLSATKRLSSVSRIRGVRRVYTYVKRLCVTNLPVLAVGRSVCLLTSEVLVTYYVSYQIANGKNCSKLLIYKTVEII